MDALVNAKILGDEFNPAQWKFPAQKNASPKKMGELKSIHTVARKLLNQANAIIEINIADALRKEKHVAALDNIRAAIKLIRKKNRFCR